MIIHEQENGIGHQSYHKGLIQLTTEDDKPVFYAEPLLTDAEVDELAWDEAYIYKGWQELDSCYN